VRVSGPIIQQAIGDQGANIVAVTAPETYEAVERGVVSTIGGAIDFPVNYGIMELLSDWSDPGVGQYSTFGMWVNADAYAALPDDLREQFDQVAEELNEVAAGQCQQMKDAPTVKSLTAWDEQDTRAWQDALGDSGEEMWIKLATEQGLEDAEGVLERYIDGLETYDDVAYDDATVACVASFAGR
jgi:TRAP-type C4-dicarboxylate transport system substrate-binding protein